MYDISDKRNAVKEVQRLLQEISETHIPQSGIYDENTKNAIIDFQKKNSIAETGITDKETLDALYREYLISYIDVPENIDFPIAYGCYGDHIRDINEKMGTVLDYYRVHHNLRSSKRYSNETQNTAEKIRQIYLLDSSTEIDKELYLRIETDIKSISYKEI